jgi:hypothetical protein
MGLGRENEWVFGQGTGQKPSFFPDLSNRIYSVRCSDIYAKQNPFTRHQLTVLG